MTITIHDEMIQGSEEWFDARRGLLTASEMHLIVTPKQLKAANNDKARAHLFELLAQRITGYTEPSYISDDMLRGKEEEILALDEYAKNYGELSRVGFVTNNEWGFTLGCSPDALVGDDGIVEVKSRRMKYQVETIIRDEVPEEYLLQIQTMLLITGRKWCDFITYSGGLPMFTKRVAADKVMHDGIVAASAAFHEQMANTMTRWVEMMKNPANRLIPTERRIEEEIIV